jgi:hypothetical protein
MKKLSKKHDQRIAMNRNIFKQRLLLQGWLVVDRMSLREASDIEHGRSGFLSDRSKKVKTKLKSRVSEPF